MRMNMRKWRESLIKQHQRAAIPVMTHPGIEAIGATVKQAVTQGEIQYRAIHNLAESYPTSASTMIMDLSVEAEAFGAPVQFTEHEIPTVTGALLHGEAEIGDLVIPDMDKARLPQYVEAAQKAAEAIRDRPVFAGCIGPFSLAGRLFGMTEIMTALLLDPESVQLLLEKCTAFLEEYIHQFKKHGANGIFIAEPAAGMLSPDMCESFSSQYVRQLVSSLQDDHFMIVLHNCGNTDPLLETMQNTGAAGLHFGNRCNIANALKFIDRNVLVMGNLDPVNIMKMETPEKIHAATLELLDLGRGYSNFVLSTGCDTPPGVPQANIDALFRALEKYNTKTR